jgi:hypothetical protein
VTFLTIQNVDEIIINNELLVPVAMTARRWHRDYECTTVQDVACHGTIQIIRAQVQKQSPK